jgi:hypothetical protein
MRGEHGTHGDATCTLQAPRTRSARSLSITFDVVGAVCEMASSSHRLARRLTIAETHPTVIRRAILALTLFWCRSTLIGPDDAGLKQIDFAAAIHLAFHELELGDLTLSLTVPVVDADHGWRDKARRAAAAHHAEQGVLAHREQQASGEALSGAAAQRKTDMMHDGLQAGTAACPRLYNTLVGPSGENRPRAWAPASPWPAGNTTTSFRSIGHAALAGMGIRISAGRVRFMSSAAAENGKTWPAFYRCGRGMSRSAGLRGWPLPPCLAERYGSSHALLVSRNPGFCVRRSSKARNGRG